MKHRTGEFDLNRRCMTPEEMRAIGMILRPNGFWIGQEMRGFKENEDHAL